MEDYNKKLRDLSIRMDEAVRVKDRADAEVRAFVTELVGEGRIELVPGAADERRLADAATDAEREKILCAVALAENIEIEFATNTKIAIGRISALDRDEESGIAYAEVYVAGDKFAVPLGEVENPEALIEFLECGAVRTV